MITSFKPFKLLLALVLVAGCGSGGGGGSGGDVGTRCIVARSAVEPYAGNSSPVVANQENAAYLASGFFSSLSTLRLLSTLYTPVPVSGGDVSNTVNGAVSGCANVSLTRNDNTAELIAEFSRLDEDGTYFDGVLEQVSLISPTNDVLIDAAFTFRNLRLRIADPATIEVAGQAIDLLVNGTLQYSEVRETRPGSNVASRRSWLGSVHIVDQVTGEEFRAEDLSIERVEYETGWSSQFPTYWDEIVSGRLFEGTDGYVDIETLEPFRYRRVEDFLPYGSGLMTFRGEDVAAYLSSINEKYFSVLLDGDGQGHAEQSRRFQWADLASILEQTFAVTTPIDSRLRISAGPNHRVELGTEVRLDASSSATVDDAWLRFEWQRLTAPVGSQALLNDVLAATPVFTPDLPGVYLFSVKVSDGIRVGYDSVQVLAIDPDSRTQVFDNAPRASMHRPADVSVGELVHLDATASSLSIPNREAIVWSWELTDAPPGSSAAIEATGDGQAQITPDVAGIYQVSLGFGDGQVSGERCEQECSYVYRTFSVDTDYRLYQPGAISSATQPRGAVLGEFNGTVGIDIAAPSGVNRTVSLLMNRSDGSFDEVRFFEQLSNVPAGSSLIESGDILGNGLNDVVTSTCSGLYIIRQIFPGQFITEIRSTGLPCPRRRSPLIDIVDVTGDGRLDIVLSGTDSVDGVVFVQKAGGVLERMINSGLAVRYASNTVFADLNGDGFTDQVRNPSLLQDGADAVVQLDFRSAGGGWEDAVLVDTGLSQGSNLQPAVGDLNDDGLLDIVVSTQQQSERAISVIYQRPDGQFAPPTLLSAGSDTRSIQRLSIDDFNGDRDKDILAWPEALAFRRPDGGFSPFINLPRLNIVGREAEASGVVRASDFNQDGLPDIFFSRLLMLDAGMGVLFQRPPDSD